MKLNRYILKLALPSIISNITVPLLGIVDLAIVGHMGDSKFIGAVSVGTMIFNVVYWLMGFLRMGTSGLTAQTYGKGDYGGMSRLLGMSLKLAALIAFGVIILQNLIFFIFISVIHPSEQVASLAKVYFSVLIWGAPAVLSSYCLNGWLIGCQNTFTPMAVAIMQNITDILASMFFVFVCGMGIGGVASGTLIAQWAGAIVLFISVRNITGKKKAKSVSGNKVIGWKHFFSVNRDVFLRTACIVTVNLLFSAMGARQGDNILAANTLLMTFFTVYSYFLDGFAYAGEAICGNAFGAGDFARLRKSSDELFAWGGVMAFSFTALYLLGGMKAVGLLTNDADVVNTAGNYLFWVILIPLAGTSAFISDGIFIGATKTRSMLLAVSASAVVFVLICMAGNCFLGFKWRNHILWLAFILFLSLRGIIQTLLLKRAFKKTDTE